MAKITVCDYVTTLKQLIAGKSGADLEKAFAGFLELLRHRRQLSLIDQILDQLRQELNSEQGVLEAQLICDDDLSDGERALVEDFLHEKSGLSQVHWLDRQSLGSPGMIIKAGGKRYDWSLKRQLERFKTDLALA